MIQSNENDNKQKLMEKGSHQGERFCPKEIIPGIFILLFIYVSETRIR